MLCNFLYGMTCEWKVGDIICAAAENDFVNTRFQVWREQSWWVIIQVSRFWATMKWDVWLKILLKYESFGYVILDHEFEETVWNKGNLALAVLVFNCFRWLETILLMIFVWVNYVMKFDIQWMKFEGDLRMLVVVSDVQHLAMKVADSEVKVDVWQHEVRCCRLK